MSLLKITLLGMAAVVAFDGVASVASSLIGFNYAYAGVGSVLVYALFGFLAGRSRMVPVAAMIGGALGLTDATLGWALSWVIGPGRVPPGQLSPLTWLIAALLVMATGCLCATIGGAVGKHLGRPRQRETQT